MKYRGIVHVHSTHSYDGKVSLMALKTLLQKEGLSFACMTEHTDTLTIETANQFINECRAFSDSSFVFVPGFEVPYKDAHVLHIGADAFVCAEADKDSLRKWSAVAPLVVLAHPVRNNFILDSVLTDCINGVEVWNQQYEGKRVPRPRSLQLLASLRAQRPAIQAFGGVDLHRVDHLGTPVTTIEVVQLTEATILAALRQGDYSFGTRSLQLHSHDSYHVTVTNRVVSSASVACIQFGKRVNALLAKTGISLPKYVVRLIRSRV